MTSSVAADLVDDFDHFYRANFGNTVAMTYGLTADLPEAHDIAQEAFCRAWSRWDRLSGFDNPAAWVRRVAVNLARSRWRRLRAAAEYLVRERPEEVKGLDPDHVAVVTALRKLPAAQREAIVLHYIVDLPLAEVAEHFQVPVGTVKSWLHRGRTALAGDLRIDIREAIAPPGTAEVIKTIEKRHRVRTTAALILVVMVVSGLIALSRMVGGHPEPAPIESPTPAPSSTVDDPMRAVGWDRATINFKTAPPTCPAGPVIFTPSEGWAVSPDRYPAASFKPALVAVGDLNGDGRAEAVLPVFCRATHDSDDVAEQLFIVERAADGTLSTVARVSERRNFSHYLWISGGVIYIDAQPRDSVGGERRLGEVEGWRWKGSTLEPVDTASLYPRIDVLNLTGVADRLPCQPAPAELRAGSGAEPVGRSGEVVFRVPAEVPAEPARRIYAGFGRSGSPYLVLMVECGAPSSAPPRRSVVVFDRIDGQWRALDALTIVTSFVIAGKTVTADTTHGSQTFTWDGRQFRQIG